MTQTSLQTHCPKCDTRFRVTDAQLSVAGGKVRCGNCMSVFNAVEHKIEESEAPAREEKTEPPVEADKLPNDTPPPEPEDDLLFADDPDEDATESNYTGTRLTFTDDELSDSFRSFNEKGETGFAVDDDEEPGESIDESWAENMLSDDEPRQVQKPEPEPEPEPKPEPEPEPDQKPEPAPQPEPRADSQPEEDYDGFFIDESEPETPYHNLRREPVAVSGGSSGRLRGFLWFLVILALLGGLVSQVVWFQFDRLSSIPQLRPFYVQGCEVFGCNLKPLVDVQSIQSRKLVVKTNPENRSQLIVDAVIINRASFEQPFPAIALTFSNLNNDIVAQSIFSPDEYLAGDGKELEAMTPDTSVRILINIRDPGKDAVNYNIAFRAQTP
jgi:predicted Zn finger-like uncharacterized protein